MVMEHLSLNRTPFSLSHPGSIQVNILVLYFNGCLVYKVSNTNCRSPDYRDYFYPLTESYEITTLLEASLGIQCWFTQAFREIYPATIERGHWVYVESTDNLWVYLGDRLIGDGWG